MQAISHANAYDTYQGYAWALAGARAVAMAQVTATDKPMAQAFGTLLWLRAHLWPQQGMRGYIDCCNDKQIHLLKRVS